MLGSASGLVEASDGMEVSHDSAALHPQVEARLNLAQREPGGGREGADGGALNLQEDVYGPLSGQVRL